MALFGLRMADFHEKESITTSNTTALPKILPTGQFSRPTSRYQNGYDQAH
jgi:hypothetical protein